MNEVTLPFDETYKSLGNLWKRFCSTLIDGIIVGIPMVILLTLVMAAMRIDPVSDRRDWPAVFIIIALVIVFVLQAGYTIGAIGRYGMTLGQKFMGLKTIREDGAPVGYALASGRYFFSILYNINFFALGTILTAISAILIVKDKKKQALHDKVCKTLVLSRS
ncbi:MAG: RDD family protein [Candidatus Omnitrophica bacterium ADurb.Bin292]|mgnify:CR=1 FL=1|jgi:uncharacterized RDD family membrane protein YckC|nr:MAG: RDD family protein [Candidatus Omnitrophica bacterium ADurb.Bin292]HOE68495.1 RDD family protein [Candidatus Omnitrophota bacterium]HQB94156.1 RDD family protein [Candidatus Omnitrophota bacterium]